MLTMNQFSNNRLFPATRHFPGAGQRRKRRRNRRITFTPGLQHLLRNLSQRRRAWGVIGIHACAQYLRALPFGHFPQTRFPCCACRRSPQVFCGSSFLVPSRSCVPGETGPAAVTWLTRAVWREIWFPASRRKESFQGRTGTLPALWSQAAGSSHRRGSSSQCEPQVLTPFDV